MSEIQVTIKFNGIREFRMFADWYDDNIGSPVPFSVTPQDSHEPGAVEPKVEPKAEPKAEPKGEPNAEPKGEPKAEPKVEPKAEDPGEKPVISQEEFSEAVKRWISKDPSVRKPKFIEEIGKIGCVTIRSIDAKYYAGLLAVMGIES
jgi:hypothetical protein